MYHIKQVSTTINVPGYVDRLNHSKIVNDKRFEHISYEHVVDQIPVQRPLIEDLSSKVVVHDKMEVYC